jgi:hypothetical protein
LGGDLYLIGETINYCRWDLFEYEGKVVEKMEIESTFEIAMKTWVGWVDKNIEKTKTKVFFRSISTEHKGKQWCYNESKPSMDDYAE